MSLATFIYSIQELQWENFPALQHLLEREVLANYITQRRWFRSKSKQIVTISSQLLPFPIANEIDVYPLQISISYDDNAVEEYFLPIALISEPEKINRYHQEMPNAILCSMKEHLIVDALFEANFRNALFEWIQAGELTAEQLFFETGSILKNNPIPKANIYSKLLSVEQTNTAIIYNDTYFFKIFRKLEIGINPDLEVVRFLSEKTNFKNAPLYGGSIQIKTLNQEMAVLGMLQNKVNNRGDAWNTMLSLLDTYYEKIITQLPAHSPVFISKDRMYFMDAPAFVRNLIGRETYSRVIQLAQRTAEMHIALASDQSDADFASVPFTSHDQQQLCESQFHLVHDKLNALAQRLHTLPTEIASEAQLLLDMKSSILARLENITHANIHATQIRVHGDYHLGQVLDSGDDFYIIDFEGEPLRPIEERRLKTSPFKDVAGMVRSFHYAAYGALYLYPERYTTIDTNQLEAWASCWYHYIHRFYLTAYFDRVEKQSFIPQNKQELDLLLKTFILEKAIYEVGYEMNARPTWLRIPLRGALVAMGI